MKAEHNKRIFILLLLILIIPSCTSKMKTVEQITPTLISDIETPTITIPTVENTLSPTPELNSVIEVEKSCMSLENLPVDQNLTGVFIRQYTYPYLENLDESTKYQVPLDGGGTLEYWSIAPNGKWFAYLDRIIDTSNPRGILRTEGGYSLKVIHSSGHSLSMDYWPVSYQGIQGWVDDQHLLLGLDGRDIVLNPFSGRWHEVEKPAWLNEDSLKNMSGDISYQYSPLLNQIIIHLNDHSEVREVNNGKLIYGLSGTGFIRESVWSPNGIMLGIITNKGVLNIFQKNEAILNIDLSQSTLLTRKYNEGFYLSNMKWSYNSTKLIIETFDDLLMLDVNEKKLYGICFLDEKLERVWFRKSFFYLENGKYLVTSLYSRDESYSFETFDVLVDLINMRAYKLDTPKYKQRIGWLSLP